MPRRARTAPRRAPSQKRAEDTVSVLLRATELAIAKDGFHATTTNGIAQLAGVSIGTLYHYFPTKEALVQAVVHRMWREEFEALAANAALLETQPIAEATRALVRALVAVIAKRRELVMRWYSEASHLGDLQTGLEMSEAARRLVEEAFVRRKGELRPRDLGFAADLVVKTALAMVRTASRDYPEQLASGVFADELADMLARYLVKG